MACRAIAEAHGGRLEARTEGTGSPLRAVAAARRRSREGISRGCRLLSASAILMLEDDPSFGGVVEEELRSRGHEVDARESVAEARARVGEGRFDVAAARPAAAGRQRPRRACARSSAEALPVEALVLTGNAEVPSALEADAARRLRLPLEAAAARRAERAGAEGRREGTPAARERRRCACGCGATSRWHGFVTEDPATKQMLETLERAAASTLPVLIQGETGTGKELLARALHEHSPRSAFPFVPLNCAALPETLIESELFGHERGAFTGAIDRKLRPVRGGEPRHALPRRDRRAEPAAAVAAAPGARDPGVLPGRRHAAGARGRARRVGDQPRPARRRSRPSRFRRDLFYRLNGVALRVPPLRERRGDIPLLARHFLDRVRRQAACSTPAAIAAADRVRLAGQRARAGDGDRPRGDPQRRSDDSTPEDLPLEVRPAGEPRGCSAPTSRSPRWSGSTSWRCSRRTAATAAARPRPSGSIPRRSTTSSRPGASRGALIGNRSRASAREQCPQQPPGSPDVRISPLSPQRSRRS